MRRTPTAGVGWCALRHRRRSVQKRCTTMVFTHLPSNVLLALVAAMQQQEALTRLEARLAEIEQGKTPPWAKANTPRDRPVKERTKRAPPPLTGHRPLCYSQAAP